MSREKVLHVKDIELKVRQLKDNLTYAKWVFQKESRRIKHDKLLRDRALKRMRKYNLLLRQARKLAQSTNKKKVQ